MHPNRAVLLCIAFIFSFSSLSGQTELDPGDMAVIALSSDKGPCGEPAGSDEISIVTFVELQMNTTFDITDNGWEVNLPNAWGGTEGTIRITRTGGPVPAGSVITIYCDNVGPEGAYQVVNPDDDWDVAYINPSGGPVNHENGTDQIYILQGGTWENHNQNADYVDGKVIYGFNSLPTWAADGTVNQSNLHPEVDPCYNVALSFGPAEFVKFTNPLTPATQQVWLERIQDPANWNSLPNCGVYAGGIPDFVNIVTSVEIQPTEATITCAVCSGCPTFDETLTFNLPPGDFTLQYTDGTDTFEIEHVQNGHTINLEISETTIFTVVSVQPYAQPCPLPLSLAGMVIVEANHVDPGEYNMILQCPDGPPIILLNYLNGTPDSGGVWNPPITLNQYYQPAVHGPGTFIYTTSTPGCPKDTATIDISFVDASESIVVVGCDQNGTPYDITDDRIMIDLTLIADPFGDSIIMWLSNGTITPNSGYANQTITCLLEPGTATGSSLILFVRGVNYPFCEFQFEIEPPGFCSNPCDTLQSASLFGDDPYLCLNGCPDEPAPINIDIDGGTGPFRMDLRISAPGFPSWVFSDVQVDEEAELDICLAAISEPTYDPTSGSIQLPEALAGTVATFTLEQIYDDYECTGEISPSEYQLEIKALPQLSTHSFSLCDDMAESVDLTQYDPFISLFYDVGWYDGDPLEGGDEIYNPTDANLLNVVELWAHVEDGFCENSVQINFTLLPTPELQPVDSIPLCSGDALDLNEIELTDANNSMANYTFHDSLPPDTSNQINPLIITPEDSMTIFVHAVAGMCYDTIPIDILVEDVPTFSLEGLPCDLANDTYDIVFESQADTVIANAGTVIINPGGPDTIQGIPNDASVFIQLESQTGLCIDTLTIEAPNCNCPEIASPEPLQDTVAICEGEDIPTLEVNVNPGLVVNWYSQLSGGMLLASNTSTYQPGQATSATYYAEALDPNTGCYSLRKGVRLQVQPLAELEAVADQTLCENTSFNITDLTPGVLNAVPGTGQWIDGSNGMPVSGVITPTDGNTYTYEYVTTNGQCPSETSFSVQVDPLPQFQLAVVDCIDSTLTFNITFATDADIVSPDAGILTEVSPGNFTLEDVPFDTDISIALEFNGSDCDTIVAFAAPDCSCPPLLGATSLKVCDDEGNLDLGAFVGAGVDGAWELVSTPPGTQPATLTGNQFMGVDADPGMYTLQFIRSVILQDCIDTAQFELTLQTSPEADAGTDLTVCAGEDALLNGSASGDNITTQWITDGSGVLSDPGTLNTGYSPTMNDIIDGTVGFSLIVTDQTGFCPSDTAFVIADINTSAWFILDAGSQVYCDTADIIIDLDALISFGTTAGEWFFPDTVPPVITGSSMLNPSDLEAGTYTVFYRTTTATPPCEDDTASVSLVIETCSCPSVAVSNPSGAICNDATNEDLDQYLITPEPGTWSVVNTPPGSNPAVINGSTFIADDADGGIYTMRFTLDNPVAGCPEFAEIALEVVEYPGLDIVSAQCSDDLTSWELLIVSDGDEINNSLGMLTPQPDDHYMISGIPLDTDIQISAGNGGGLCISILDAQAPDCACTLDLANLPDEATICVGDTLALEAMVSGAKGSVDAHWEVQGNNIPGTSVNAFSAGTYTFVAEDSLGCLVEQDIEVSFYEEMQIDASAVDVSCPGDTDGAVIIQGIQGGSTPFFISINGGTLEELQGFPATFESFPAGDVSIAIQDGFGCEIAFDLQIASASQEDLSLGPDLTILLGDSIRLDPSLSFVPDSFYWSGDTGTIDFNALEQWVKPSEDLSLTLTAFDANGCEYMDDIFIRVRLSSSVYIPNIFSPNGDGINDLIVPLVDPTIENIDYFEIFNRWGEIVFSNTHFPPNDPLEGWDGQMDGQLSPPGVYVYRLAASNAKGDIVYLKGDLTLVR